MRLINPLAIIRILSTILLIEALSFLVCFPVALIYKESLFPFLWPFIISLLCYAFFRLISIKANINKISNRDTFLIVTFAWILFPLFGSLPYIFSNSITSLINALFESTSGFTTTGASILTEIEPLPYSILFWRSLTHWIGGIGIIVLVILILPSLNVTGYHLFTLESSLSEKIHPKAKGVVRRIMIIYFGLTLAEILLLLPGGMNLFDSICHAFGTVATGGFSPKNDSLVSYSPYCQYVVMIFMFLAGTSQVVYYNLAKLNFRKVIHNEEFWFYLFTVMATGALAVIFLLANTSKHFEEAFREGFFQIVSIITCTGFATADYNLWPLAGITLIFLLMFSGGSTGSTSGGIKLARHLVLLKNINRVLVQQNHPNAIVSVRVNGMVIDERTNFSIISFVILYILVFAIGTVILLINGSDLIVSASSVATCMAGIGPGMGSVGPMGNFADIPGLSKIVLSAVMIIGRLEIITVFALFSRSFWRL